MWPSFIKDLGLLNVENRAEDSQLMIVDGIAVAGAMPPVQFYRTIGRCDNTRPMFTLV